MELVLQKFVNNITFILKNRTMKNSFYRFSFSNGCFTGALEPSSPYRAPTSGSIAEFAGNGLSEFIKKQSVNFQKLLFVLAYCKFPNISHSQM